PRLHVPLAQRNAVEVAGNPESGARRGLGERTRDPGRAQVLQTLEQPFLLHLETRLDQEFLRKRVADLHTRALGFRSLLELLRSEDRRAADAVASGLRTEEKTDV